MLSWRVDQVRARAFINQLRVVKITTALSAAVVAVGLLGFSTGKALVRESVTPQAAAGDTPITTLFFPLISRPLSAYYDGFDDPSSGWAIGAALRYNDFCDWVDSTSGCSGLQEVAYFSYTDSNYRFYVPLTWHGGGSVDTWFVWPVQTAPLPAAHYPLPDSYCVEARGRFSSFEGVDYQPWWAHWGIVFGADEDLSEVYTLQVNANHDMAVLQYHNYTYPGNRQPLGGEEINVEIPWVSWSGDMKDLISTHGYNTLKVAVRGQLVYVYVNGRLMNIVRISGMPRAHVGLIGGSWEVTPVQLDISDFRYDPFCSG
jgi:hypothetical protein